MNKVVTLTWWMQIDDPDPAIFDRLHLLEERV